MASKDQFMWELVVVSIGKRSMVMDHHLCLPFQSLRFVHGAAAAQDAAEVHYHSQWDRQHLTRKSNQPQARTNNSK